MTIQQKFIGEMGVSTSGDTRPFPPHDLYKVDRLFLQQAAYNVIRPLPANLCLSIIMAKEIVA